MSFVCSQGVQRIELASGKDELRGQKILGFEQRDRRNAGPVPYPDSFRTRPTSVKMNTYKHIQIYINIRKHTQSHNTY